MAGAGAGEVAALLGSGGGGGAGLGEAIGGLTQPISQGIDEINQVMCALDRPWCHVDAAVFSPLLEDVFGYEISPGQLTFSVSLLTLIGGGGLYLGYQQIQEKKVHTPAEWFAQFVDLSKMLEKVTPTNNVLQTVKQFQRGVNLPSIPKLW